MKPLLNQRYNLSFKAVLVRGLNNKMQVLKNASGFIRREGNDHYLYTCWHVVTGYNRNELKVKDPPEVAFLEVYMQDAQSRGEGTTVIGGLQTTIIELYDITSIPKKPLWLQDNRHVPHPDLNNINIFVPFWHDAIKILLPKKVRISGMQVIAEDNFFPANTILTPGDKVYISGFPYGFSAAGLDQPTPIVLTRFVASIKIGNRHQEILIDSAGAPAMSGSPVFIERESEITLLGLYTGSLFPDHIIKSNDPTTALGTCSNMTLLWWDALIFTQHPNESSESS